MTEDEARAALRECCGAAAWVEGMIARRPFAARSDLLEAADEVWWRLKESDWREAFAAHPQIGATQTGGEASDQNWSQQEQAGMQNAGADTRRAIAEGNRAYLEKFGYIYIVCATGKTSDELLGILRGRLTNDPATEIRIAATEQGKITRLRLRKLLST